MTRCLITPPTQEPLALEEVKGQLHEYENDQDDLLAGFLQGAREDVEKSLNRAFMTQTWEMVLDSFPCGEIELLPAPLQSVTHIKYIDTDGEEQSWDAGNYQVSTVSEPGRIRPVYGQYWPTTKQRMDAVRIQYVAGYESADDIPRMYRIAILQLVATMNRHREATDDGPGEIKEVTTPGSFTRIVRANKIRTF